MIIEFGCMVIGVEFVFSLVVEMCVGLWLLVGCVIVFGIVFIVFIVIVMVLLWIVVLWVVWCFVIDCLVFIGFLIGYFCG